MADGPYRHYGAGAGQQQHFYYQQNHSGPPRHINRTGSPVIGGRNLYNTDTPSPSRSPVSQGPSNQFTMFNQSQAAQNSMMNGGGNQARYMQMNLQQHKYQQHPSHQQNHHNHHPQQQAHGGHPGHNGMGHQHTYSSGLNQISNFGGNMTNGGLNEDHNDLGEGVPEHWQRQLHAYAESRQAGQTGHKHSRKGGALLANKVNTQAQTEDSSREGEQVERNRAMAIVNEDPRQDWDGIDMSGQGLRNVAMRLFQDYTFLTKLFVDNNKLAALPYGISSLRNLTLLQASGNQLRELPETIGMLSKLEQLLVFDNNIRTLPVELGYLYKLEMLGIEGNPLEENTREFLVQNGTQALVTHLRDNTEPGTPPLSRPMLILDESESGEKFTVLDYNILCDKYATRSQYKYTPAKALEWEYRRDLILNEIRVLDADMVCLQEVDQENFHDFFRRELALCGYKGMFWPKSRARTMTEREAKLVDGCAIFYKGQKFICLDKQLIDFGNTAINRPDMKGEHDIFNRVMPRDHIAVLAFFENRMTGARMIVANAHIYWDPKFVDVKLVQTAILMDQTTKFAEKWADMPACTNKAAFRHTEQDGDLDGAAPPEVPAPEPGPSQSYASGMQIPLVVCGDFNSAKDTGVYQLLAQGFVPPDHSDLTGRRYGGLTRDGIAHPFKLRSAYNGDGSTGDAEYLEFTNYTPGFSGCIEYIWHSTNLRCTRLLGNVDFDYLQKVPGFPNFHFPSDHIPLFAEFALEPRKERKVVEANFGS